MKSLIFLALLGLSLQVSGIYLFYFLKPVQVRNYLEMAFGQVNKKPCGIIYLKSEHINISAININDSNSKRINSNFKDTTRFLDDLARGGGHI